MSEWMVNPQFEDNIRKAFDVPEIRTAFVTNLQNQIMQKAEEKERAQIKNHRIRFAWIMAAIIISVLFVSTLIIGPQKVYASFMKLFGYIPDVGIVNQEGGLRVLANPVQMESDGITVSVNQAVLTRSETILKYGVSGVPSSAYPKGEQVTGCVELEYLRLPDGSRIEINDPIPQDVDSATFVMPCIFNSLPGTVPTDWELALRFIPAPPDFEILPVIEVVPTEISTAIVKTETISEEENIIEIPSHAEINVTRVIETEDGYILLGSVIPKVEQGNFLEITGAIYIRDASGNTISYTYPMDIQNSIDPADIENGVLPWIIQIKGAGVNFPILISLSGVVVSQVDPQATARLDVDLGENPQPGDVIEINQDIEIAGQKVRLLTITADSQGGYSFRIDPGESLNFVSVAIDGYPAAGGGGGGIGQGVFNTSLAYVEIPKGKQTLIFNNPLASSPTEIWQVEWRPENVRAFEAGENEMNVCWTADTIQNIPDLTEGLDGRVFFTRVSQDLKIMMANLDGSDQQIIAEGAARASLSPDGSKVAYSTNDGIVIKDLSSGEIQIIPGTFGRITLWSPDGNRIANVTAGDQYGIFVMDLNGANVKQLSNLGYESLAGWSMDGQKLYYAIPGAEGNGFMLRAVDVNSAETEDLFVLEDSSRKAPEAAISPDGKWVAYRAVDNSSLYLKGMDGSPARMLLDHPALAINGISWEKEGNLLGVSLITEGHPEGEIILIAPDSCETYRLPELIGALDGIIIP